ncbi:MAG: hypothetical protein V8T86_11255 [Victivallis sp.]
MKKLLERIVVSKVYRHITTVKKKRQLMTFVKCLFLSAASGKNSPEQSALVKMNGRVHLMCSR